MHEPPAEDDGTPSELKILSLLTDKDNPSVTYNLLRDPFTKSVFRDADSQFLRLALALQFIQKKGLTTPGAFASIFSSFRKFTNSNIAEKNPAGKIVDEFLVIKVNRNISVEDEMRWIKNHLKQEAEKSKKFKV